MQLPNFVTLKNVNHDSKLSMFLFLSLHIQLEKTVLHRHGRRRVDLWIYVVVDVAIVVVETPFYLTGLVDDLIFT